MKYRASEGGGNIWLDTTFQSWFVAEHKARGLPKETLSSTLALVSAPPLSCLLTKTLSIWKMLKVTTCNSLLAIFAGLLSDLLVRGLSLGPLAPFLAAIVSFQIRFLGKLVDFEHYRSAQTFNIFQPCLAAGLFTISLGWTENYGSQTGSLVEKYRQVC